MAQCCLYVFLMFIVKLTITLFMQLDFWENVKDFILSPIPDPKVELAFVMLIIPFFVNMLMFWVTDNFLMYKDPSKRRRNSSEQSLLQKANVKYRSLRKKKRVDSERISPYTSLIAFHVLPELPFSIWKGTSL
ncbi:unnamed protein product [Callosobruchus maculatus]|uniref:Uncharacterized protein n=1 Tax=Callosobruchus maculatus TaxID=64391 RepID=A0A653C3Y4_CALMS|nr:unnamed protein product [Callosobruchus maculatus]